MFWIAENEQAALGMNATGPFLQFAQTLKLLPILRTLENINVRFDIGQRLVALQFLRHHAIVKLCFHGDWRRHISVSEMINVMLGLAVFPLRWINAEGSFPERSSDRAGSVGRIQLLVMNSGRSAQYAASTIDSRERRGSILARIEFQ